MILRWFFKIQTEKSFNYWGQKRTKLKIVGGRDAKVSLSFQNQYKITDFCYTHRDLVLYEGFFIFGSLNYAKQQLRILKTRYGNYLRCCYLPNHNL